mmetsp:Transcript_27820/g.56264  ORF Transcript_27820/g.56264 Transcript_27820/m.56264 type:complete len:194 (-) Transcript_27820:115-696(-)
MAGTDNYFDASVDNEALATESSKRQRVNKVTFASPVVSKTHHVPSAKGQRGQESLHVAAGYARSAALFAVADEPDDDDEYYGENFANDDGEGILICPAAVTESSVSFAYPVVTHTWEIPRYSDEEKEELFYNSMDFAAFSINEVLAGRDIFGRRNECSRQIPFGSACDDNVLLASNGFEISGIEHSHPPVMIL